MDIDNVANTQWRLIMTDTESVSGIAPVCTSPRHPEDDAGNFGVYDCCPWPQIECWSEPIAEHMVERLNGSVVTTPTYNFDRDPNAVAWASNKVQHHIDRAVRFWMESEATGRIKAAHRWRGTVNYMKQSLIGGEGCVIAAFDHRLPEWRKLTDANKAVSGKVEGPGSSAD